MKTPFITYVAILYLCYWKNCWMQLILSNNMCVCVVSVCVFVLCVCVCVCVNVCECVGVVVYVWSYENWNTESKYALSMPCKYIAMIRRERN